MKVDSFEIPIAIRDGVEVKICRSAYIITTDDGRYDSFTRRGQSGAGSVTLPGILPLPTDELVTTGEPRLHRDVELCTGPQMNNHWILAKDWHSRPCSASGGSGVTRF
jgi:hypothetical protein